MEEHKLVFLGDYHLHEFYNVKKDDKDLKFSNSEENTIWYTDPKFTAKHVKSRYEGHVLKSGVPDVVVVGVGGKDLTFRKNINCVISSIFRLFNFLLSGGVKAVVVLSLQERNLPPPYNDDVKKINHILASKAKHCSGLFFLNYTWKTNFNDCDYTDGILLIPHFYTRFYKELRKMLTKKVLTYIKSPEVLNKIQQKKPLGGNIIEQSEKINEEETDKEVAELTREIEDLIGSFSGTTAPKAKQKHRKKRK